jgi:hypothetical protein
MSSRPIGIIAEDLSDVNSIKIIIERIIHKTIKVKHYVGFGCGRIYRKCDGWAKSLYWRECRILFIIHDADTNSPQEICFRIQNSLKNSPINKYLICIPIQELEAWLLSDSEGIKLAFNLSEIPKLPSEPETINSPKEYLGQVIKKASRGTRVYINTKHNEIIASKISIQHVKQKCPAFIPFFLFVNKHLSSN